MQKSVANDLGHKTNDGWYEVGWQPGFPSPAQRGRWVILHFVRRSKRKILVDEGGGEKIGQGEENSCDAGGRGLSLSPSAHRGERMQ